MNQNDLVFVEHLREQSLWLGFPAPEAVPPDHNLVAGDVLKVGSIEAQILEVPGHSPGSVAFWLASEGVCISGDVLFQGSVGRTDLPGCSHAQLLESLRHLHKTLPPDTRILPGHGEATTMQEEWLTNPHLKVLQS
jgi:glyoxylase-like metal-dependent hydrolase (beta-lactamase superfamily II)